MPTVQTLDLILSVCMGGGWYHVKIKEEENPVPCDF